MTKLSICHFNDVYRVTPQKVSPTSSDTVDVTQFAAMLNAIRDQWPERADGKREGKSVLDNASESDLDSTIRRARVVFWGFIFAIHRKFGLKRKPHGAYSG